jgi:hypothetical protein
MQTSSLFKMGQRTQVKGLEVDLHPVLTPALLEPFFPCSHQPKGWEFPKGRSSWLLGLSSQAEWGLPLPA